MYVVATCICILPREIIFAIELFYYCIYNFQASESSSQIQPLALGPSKDAKGSGIIGASFNLMNALIGEAIVAIPSAIREAGLTTGVVMLVLVALTVEYTLYILLSVSVSVGCSSYQEVMRKAFGKVGCIAAVVAQLALTFSGICVHGTQSNAKVYGLCTQL